MLPLGYPRPPLVVNRDECIIILTREISVKTKTSLPLLAVTAHTTSQSSELNVLLSLRHQTRGDNNDHHAFNQCWPRPLRSPLAVVLTARSRCDECLEQINQPRGHSIRDIDQCQYVKYQILAVMERHASEHPVIRYCSAVSSMCYSSWPWTLTFWPLKSEAFVSRPEMHHCRELGECRYRPTLYLKNCAKLFLSELCQISINCENSSHKNGTDNKLMWGPLIFHLTWFMSTHFIGVARNLSWRGHSSWGRGGTPGPWMAAVSFSNRLLDRKIETWRNFLLKMYFLGILGGGIAPFCPSLATPIGPPC